MPDDALTAQKNGAQGIGLCRTEHIVLFLPFFLLAISPPLVLSCWITKNTMHTFQFFALDKRIKAVRKMIMVVTTEQRNATLNLLLPYQRFDFEGIFRAMDGLPVTIRLLDPPLHEFLPEGEINEIVEGLTSDTGMSADEVHSRIEKLSEINPMLGFRGCRSSNLLKALYANVMGKMFLCECTQNVSMETFSDQGWD